MGMWGKIIAAILAFTFLQGIHAFALAAGNENKKVHHKSKGKHNKTSKPVGTIVDVCPGVGTTITVAKAKIRDISDTGKVVGFVKFGDLVFVTAGKVDGLWYPVKTKNGKEGLVSAKILEPRACVQEWIPIKEIDKTK